MVVLARPWSLFHSDEEVLIELLPQNALGVGVVLVFVFVRADGNDGVLRCCAHHVEQLDAPVYRCWHGHGLQVCVLRKIELEAKVSVGVGSRREISVFGILSSSCSGGGERRGLLALRLRKSPCLHHQANQHCHPQCSSQTHPVNPQTIVRLWRAGVNAVEALMCVSVDIGAALGIASVAGGSSGRMRWPTQVQSSRCRRHPRLFSTTERGLRGEATERRPDAAVRMVCGTSWTPALPAHALSRHDVQGAVPRQRLRPGAADSLLHRADDCWRSTECTAISWCGCTTSTARTRRPTPQSRFAELPRVTIQLPIFNEQFVIDRLVECDLQAGVPARVAGHPGARRLDRRDGGGGRRGGGRTLCARWDTTSYTSTAPIATGFKAGALEHGLKTAKGEFVAIFDADFTPAQRLADEGDPSLCRAADRHGADALDAPQPATTRF